MKYLILIVAALSFGAPVPQAAQAAGCGMPATTLHSGSYDSTGNGPQNWDGG